MNNTFTNRPVTMNENKNLLEIEEHMYILDDVKKPNVFRNMFPYSEIPKIPFNDRTVPHDMPKDIWITDTTFRDGQQSRAPYSTEQIVTIYDYLHRLGGENGLIRASEFFLYSKKDRDAVYKCLEKGYKFPEITSWIRASKEDFKLVKEIGMKEGFDVGLEMSGSQPGFNNMIDNMKNGGKIALLGLQRADARINWEKVIFNGLTIRGIYGRKVWETWYKMSTMLQSGLNVDDIITHRFDVRDFEKGFEAMNSGMSGKVILDWTKLEEEA